MTTAPAAGSYRLTTKFIAVGQKALSSVNIIHIAAPHLEALNIDTGETINFSSREDDHAILIYKLEPTTGMLRTNAYIGQHMPLYCSAMGKIYMAFGHADCGVLLGESSESDSAVNPQYHYRKAAAMYDERGANPRKRYGDGSGRKTSWGVSCIAVPVFDIHGQVPYSVSISLSTSRLKQVGKNFLKPRENRSGNFQ